jgi:hypothetical protein
MKLLLLAAAFACAFVCAAEIAAAGEDDPWEYKFNKIYAMIDKFDKDAYHLCSDVVEKASVRAEVTAKYLDQCLNNTSPYPMTSYPRDFFAQNNALREKEREENIKTLIRQYWGAANRDWLENRLSRLWPH